MDINRHSTYSEPETEINGDRERGRRRKGEGRKGEGERRGREIWER